MKTYPILSLAAVVMLATGAHAAVIYSDDFSGLSSTNLNGLAPDARPGSETWSAATDWKADGTVAASATYSGAYLPFTPENGKTYTLSMDMDVTAGNAGHWFALVFSQGGVTSGPGAAEPYAAGNYAAPWMLESLEGNVSTFMGPSVAGQVNASGTINGTVNLEMVLDTTAALWSVAFYRNDALITSSSYTTNPTINYVGFYKHTSTGGTVDNFSLTYVPEPSSIMLVSLAGVGLLRRRRG